MPTTLMARVYWRRRGAYREHWLNRQVVVRVGVGAAELPRGFGPDFVVTHELGHRILAAVMTTGHQLLLDARAAVARLELGMDGADLHEQRVLPLLAGAGWAVPPGVVAGWRDVQRIAQHAHRPLVAMFVDEAEHHIAS
jgi:hypothetical protein